MELQVFIEELSEWVDILDCDFEELQEKLQKDTCYITDVDSDFNYSFEGAISISELEDITEKLNEIDNQDLDYDFKAILEYLGSWDFEEAYNIVISGEYSFNCDINDDESLGYYLVDEGIMFDNIPDEVKNYLDYEAIGRDYRFNTSSCFTDYDFIELY